MVVVFDWLLSFLINQTWPRLLVGVGDWWGGVQCRETRVIAGIHLLVVSVMVFRTATSDPFLASSLIKFPENCVIVFYIIMHKQPV